MINNLADKLGNSVTTLQEWGNMVIEQSNKEVSLSRETSSLNTREKGYE